ncbi:hypothetical protein ACDZ28_09215 [Paenibacillus sp. RS8]|uniref:hypothetical protein n=1 Tax=unclassified Paenibacillus TaxID=185978 RepID=UPI0030D93F32
MYQSTSGKICTQSTHFRDSPEGRKYMQLLVVSVLHQMKNNQTKKGGSHKEHTK